MKRFVQSGEKNVPPGDSLSGAYSLKDEISMLEKTGNSSGSSIQENSSNLDIHRLRQEQFQHNAAGHYALGDHDNVLGMKVSAQKVQNINRMIRRVPTEGESVVQVPIKGNQHGEYPNCLSRSSRVQLYLDSACSSSEHTPNSGGSPHSRSSSKSSGAFERDSRHYQAPLHPIRSTRNHYNSPLSW